MLRIRLLSQYTILVYSSDSLDSKLIPVNPTVQSSLPVHFPQTATHIWREPLVHLALLNPSKLDLCHLHKFLKLLWITEFVKCIVPYILWNMFNPSTNFEELVEVGVFRSVEAQASATVIHHHLNVLHSPWLVQTTLVKNFLF